MSSNGENSFHTPSLSFASSGSFKSAVSNVVSAASIRVMPQSKLLTPQDVSEFDPLFCQSTTSMLHGSDTTFDLLDLDFPNTASTTPNHVNVRSMLPSNDLRNNGSLPSLICAAKHQSASNEAVIPGVTAVRGSASCLQQPPGNQSRPESANELTQRPEAASSALNVGSIGSSEITLQALDGLRLADNGNSRVSPHDKIVTAQSFLANLPAISVRISGSASSSSSFRQVSIEASSAAEDKRVLVATSAVPKPDTPFVATQGCFSNSGSAFELAVAAPRAVVSPVPLPLCHSESQAACSSNASRPQNVAVPNASVAAKPVNVRNCKERNTILCWIVSPSLIWLQDDAKMKDANTKSSWSLEELRYCWDGGVLMPVSPGDAKTGCNVMALYADENNGYYRARIVKPMPSITLKTADGRGRPTDFVLVLYIDYGNTAFVARESLWQMPDCLRSAKWLAKRARLFGFVPRNGVSWSAEECTVFESLLKRFASDEDRENDTLHAFTTLEIPSRTNSRRAVSFSFRSGNPDSPPVELRTLLIENGFREYTGTLNDFPDHLPADSKKDESKLAFPPRDLKRWQVAGIAGVISEAVDASISSAAFSVPENRIGAVQKFGSQPLPSQSSQPRPSSSYGAASSSVILTTSNSRNTVDNQPSFKAPATSQIRTLATASRPAAAAFRAAMSIARYQFEVPPSGEVSFAMISINLPTDFYVRILCPGDDEKYTAMHNAMDNFYGSMTNRQVVGLGELPDGPYCAVADGVDELHFFRGQVTQMPKPPIRADAKCQVFLVDRGCTIGVTITKIYHLKDCFGALPMRAVRCTLGLLPAPLKAGAHAGPSDWPDEAVVKFMEYCKGTMLFGVVLSTTDPMWLIVKKDSVAHGYQNEEMPINAILLNDGLALQQ